MHQLYRKNLSSFVERSKKIFGRKTYGVIKSTRVIVKPIYRTRALIGGNRKKKIKTIHYVFDNRFVYCHYWPTRR